MREWPERNVTPLTCIDLWTWGSEHAATFVLALAVIAATLHIRAALRDWQPGEYDDWDDSLGD